jgi:2-polyprenyl-6-methoxyphenol hydroxylase-like FAD-dependent oxidoreductase
MAINEQSHKRRAIVIGGSIAGLFVGAFLRRLGWQVDIYERSSIELIGRGVGIFATHLELFEALDRCGAGTVDIGVIAYKRITFDRNGDVIADKPLLQIVTSWDRLRQVLLKAIDRQRYHFGHVFERVEQDGNGVEVRFANGRSERADLLVACDGFRSIARASRRACSQFIPVIISGAAHQMNPIFCPKPAGPCFPTCPFFRAISFKVSAIRSRVRTMNYELVNGDTISLGIE